MGGANQDELIRPWPLQANSRREVTRGQGPVMLVEPAECRAYPCLHRRSMTGTMVSTLIIPALRFRIECTVTKVTHAFGRINCPDCWTGVVRQSLPKSCNPSTRPHAGRVLTRTDSFEGYGGRCVGIVVGTDCTERRLGIRDLVQVAEGEHVSEVSPPRLLQIRNLEGPELGI